MTCQNIYEAPAGTTPIQTDSGLEYRRFRDRALRRMGVGAALLLGGLLWAGRLLLRLGQWRRGADGRTLPAPGRWSALAAAVCGLAGRLVLGAACLTFLMDVVQSALRGEWLLLLAAHTSWIEEPYRVEFKEETYYTLEKKIADSWTLPWPWLADWTAEWCRRQLGAAGQPPLEGYEGVWHIRSGERTETADRGESGWVLRYRAKCRQVVAEGEPFPVPRRWGARLRGIRLLIEGVLIAVLVLCLLLSIGEGQTNYIDGYSAYTREQNSIAAASFEYCRYDQEEGDLWVERMDCRAGWLAEWICEDFRAAEGDEKRLQREFHRHGPTALREVELGFDRAWSYSSGEYEGLILRDGNQVLRIEGNQIDLTGAKTLADIRTWLAEGA